MGKNNIVVFHDPINTYTLYTTFTPESFVKNTMDRLAGIVCYIKIGVSFKRPNDYKIEQKSNIFFDGTEN